MKQIQNTNIFKLEEIAKFYLGKILKKPTESKGEYPLISSTSKNDGIIGKVETFNFQNCITLPRLGIEDNIFITLRKYKFSATSHLIIVKPNKNIVILDFLYLLLKSLNAKISQYAIEGDLIKRLSLKKLKSLKLSIPELSIQKEIVQNWKKTNESLVFFEKFFENPIFQINNLLVKTLNYVMNKSNKQNYLLSDLLDKQKPYKMGKINFESDDKKNNLYILTYKSFKNNNLNDKMTFYDEKLESFFANKNDVFFTRFPEPSFGIQNIYEENSAVFDSSLVKLNIDETKIQKDFFKYFNYSNFWLNWKQKNKTSTLLGGINFLTILNLTLSLPTLANQQKMILIINKLEKLIKILTNIQNKIQKIILINNQIIFKKIKERSS
ncbi:restriction endonuclease subunit S [Mesomycoplasma neurolyticum]|uniref:Restriction modification enzyme subunit S2A n=1 Tax=Mesomycoplasma neurolyticum TaxID=2120 RepID=A0A449A6K4_9BACT|nr:restriction endonuclease subunit S [Mesomycoplasma neurolyticum]VEU59115.1 restriction modification enzyme subunit S2A [Mesomycoplasma neurolyticum]VEU59768.1 restriction modification enzyme subunit S2A [Mesomycoplasma neurolyticum]VEU59859.1 restriction modification enzyme subunit S2A [Mesomycoplasma neurolyticum]VEU59907.1 restriction modification enzyme subunit S2A [Mesomycoplasma neurolyticum]